MSLEMSQKLYKVKVHSQLIIRQVQMHNVMLVMGCIWLYYLPVLCKILF